MKMSSIFRSAISCSQIYLAQVFSVSNCLQISVNVIIPTCISSQRDCFRFLNFKSIDNHFWAFLSNFSVSTAFSYLYVSTLRRKPEMRSIVRFRTSGCKFPFSITFSSSSSCLVASSILSFMSLILVIYRSVLNPSILMAMIFMKSLKCLLYNIHWTYICWEQSSCSVWQKLVKR